ncbi:MAG: pitrilysin family protein [candidate division Zixibacteria bacterium]|nr:pitrilysin family protein [candidate division Zixibacteria bacterium]
MKRKAIGLLVAAFALALTAAPSATAFEFTEVENQVVEHTLDNGLKILIVPRHEAPVASFVTWANVGSADDPKGYTGLAHMFEHMAFKGTTTLGTRDIKAEMKAIAVEDSLFMLLRAERNKGRLADSTRLAELEEAYNAAREASYELVIPNEFGNVIDREGGVGLNAFTSNDQTAYFFSLPSNKVELWMALESERFLNPVLREMYKERDVVAEERRMRTESNPIGKAIEEFLCLAFKAHPYGVPGVGHMSDIMNYSRVEAKAFFEKYYGPSNLTVAVVGDVVPNDVIKLAEKYWGRIAYRPAPERIATVEPEQIGERRMVMEDPAQPVYLAGWHIPEITHPDRTAVDMLMEYLGQGRTSVLYETMVKEKKIAIQIGAFSGFPGDKYATMCLMFAMPSQGHDNFECEQEIFAAVEKTKSELVTPADLEKMRARAKSSFINSIASNNGFAMQLCQAQQYYGDWREMFRQLDKINAVTAEDIQRVANQYLTEENRVVVMMNTAKS